MSNDNLKETIEVDVFTIETDGKTMDFAVLDMFEYKEKCYIVVAEIDSNDEIITDEIIDEGKIEIFGYDADKAIVESIDSDEEYEEIANYYEELCDSEADN